MLILSFRKIVFILGGKLRISQIITLMKIRLSSPTAILFFLLSAFQGFAQQDTSLLFKGLAPFSTWSYGLSLGVVNANNLMGINDYSNHSLSPSASLFIEKHISHALSLVATVRAGYDMEGSKPRYVFYFPTQYTGPEKYKSKLTDASLQAMWRLNSMFTKSSSRWNYYLVGGFGIATLSAEAYYPAPSTYFDHFENAVPLTFPLGFAVDHRLSNRLGIRVAYTMTYVNTDYLDATSLNGNTDVFNYVSIGLFRHAGYIDEFPALKWFNPIYALYKENSQRTGMQNDAKAKYPESRPLQKELPATATQADNGIPETDTVNAAKSTAEIEVDAMVNSSEVTVIRSGTLEFIAMSATVTQASRQFLEEAAHLLKRDHRYKVLLKGYSDNEGDEALNLTLSEIRLEEVVKLFTDQNIAMSRIKTEAHGELNPVADNSTPEGRQKNRRVEVIIYR